MRYAMIMAGGSGTRLWPVSRRDRPKQLAPIMGGRSLLDIAVERARAVAPTENTLICASAEYLGAIRDAAPELPREFLLGEPVGRDTLNAIGFTAAVLRKRDPDAVFCVLTADHLIEPLDRFARCVETGFDLASTTGRLVTFSITPTHAATGYGYVRKGDSIVAGADAMPAHRVAAFVEKPDAATAQGYVESGEYGWNSGMFVWRADAFLRAVERFQPEAAQGLSRIAEAWGKGEQESILREVYPTLPKISVDFGVMEPASAADSGFEVCAVEMDLDWRDVGSWTSYAQTLEAGDRGVRRSDGGGGATVLDCDDALIVNTQEGHHVAALGMPGVVIVHTPEATLVMPAEEAERLKELHAKLPDELK